jgi:iron complex outermembrane recepter protein
MRVLPASFACAAILAFVSVGAAEQPSSAPTDPEHAGAAEQPPVASAAPGQAGAASVSSSDTEPPPLEVVVQGRRGSSSGTTVRVIGRKDMEQLGASTVAEAIEQLPSASAGFDGRGERLVSLRGFSARQVLVMIDGVPVSMPYDGQLDLNKLPLGLVDHVTVIQGAGSLLYGPNGLGGAVNIVTREPGVGPWLVISTEAAPFATFRASTMGSVRMGSLGAVLGASLDDTLYQPMSRSFVPTYNEDGGRRDNSDRRSGSFTAKLRWEADDENALVATASHLEGRFGVPPAVFDLTPRYWRWTHWDADTVALAHAFRGSRLAFDETLYVSALGNTLDSYDDASYTTQRLGRSFRSRYADTSFGANVRGSYDLGGDAQDDVTLRAWLGARRDAHGADASASAPAVAVETVILTGAAQAEATFARRLQAIAALQIDGELPGESRTGVRPDPGLGVGPMGSFTAHAFDGLSLVATVAERTRFPTLKERFSEAFGAREPNPDLQPERATNLALDATLEPATNVRLDVGVFDSEVRDLVIPVVIRPQTEQLQNAGRARFAGAEVDARAAVPGYLEVRAGWAWLGAHRLDLAPPADRVPYEPEQKALLAVTVHPLPWLGITGATRWLGAQWFQNPDTLLWGRLGSAYQLDARIDLKPVDGLDVWVRGTNLADAFVQNRYSFPEPGRQIFVGVSSSWAAKPTPH